MSTEILSIRAFKKRPGQVFAVVSLDGERSDWVQVSKTDLIRSLRHHEITHVEIDTESDGAMIYLGRADVHPLEGTRA